MWLLFDDDALYVSFRLWESRPDNLVANEMRRDSNNIFQNDHVAFLIDPFYDRRNGIEFAINPLGGRWDGQISNERSLQPRLESDLGRQGGTLRRRLDGGDGDPVQVAALPAGPGPDLGLQRAARRTGRRTKLRS